MAASIAQCCRSLKSCNFQNANNKFELFSISYRCCSSHTPQPEIKPPGRIKTFIVKKYFNYLTKFDTKFEKTYPQIYKVYRLFKDGVRDFFIDSKMYYSVATGIWSGGPLNSFTRNELQSYQQMPNDMIRSAPILISVPLPLVPYALFPIAYMFPRYLLCRHFWTPQQRLDFALHDLKKRFVHYPKILRYLEAHSTSIRDTGKRKVFQNILLQIEKNHIPDVNAILDVKDLFTTYPFGMDHLTKRHKLHLWHLCRSLDISTRKSRLMQDLHLFHCIDLAIAKEGINSLNLPDLQQICFARGVNSRDSDEDELKNYLSNWIRIASSLDESSISMLLHCPVLLSSSWPSNQKYLISIPDEF